MVVRKLEFEATSNHQQAVTGLKEISSALNSVETAAESYAKSLEEIRRAQSAGLINQRQANNAIEEAGREYERAAKQAAALTSAQTRVAATSGRLGGAFSSLNNVSRDTRNRIQNVNFQLQDIAVQLASGTSAATTFAQQIPQLASVFGTLGTIIGTGAAIAIPLVSLAMVNAGEKSVTLEKQIDNLASAVDEFVESNERSKESVSELAEEFGNYADNIQAVIARRSELNQVDAEVQLANVVAQLAETFGDFQEVVDDTGQTIRSGYEEVLRGLTTIHQATNDEIIELAQSLEALGRAQGPEAQAAALERVRIALLAAHGTVEDMDGATRAVYRNILNVQETATELAKVRVDERSEGLLQALISAGTAASGLLGTVDSIASSIADAAANAWEFVDALAQTRAARIAGGPDAARLDTLDTFANPSGLRRDDIVDSFVFNSGARSGRRGGGGGGGSDTIGTAVDQIRSQLATENEAIKMAHEERLKILNEARAKQKISQDDFQELSKRSSQEYQDALTELERNRQAAVLSDVSGAFGDLASLMQTKNKTLFNIGKAAAIAEASVAGYSAAVKAWDKGMAIGGPPVAAAFTAASLARTGVLIANIASQNIGGGGGQSGSAGGGGGGGSGAAAAQQPAGAADGPLLVEIGTIGADELITGASFQSFVDRLQDEAGDRNIRFIGDPL